MKWLSKLLEWLCFWNKKKKELPPPEPEVIEVAPEPEPYDPGAPRTVDGKEIPLYNGVISDAPKNSGPTSIWTYPGNYDYVEDLDRGEKLVTGGNLPRGVIIHHTVSYNMDATVRHFLNHKVDVHFIIGTDGKVTQMVPCNHIAHHAGQSSWDGDDLLNRYYVGIEVVNLGPLRKKEDGKFYDAYRKEYKGQVRTREILGNKYWEPFTAIQEKALDDLVLWLLHAYRFSLGNVVGHYECSPGRKNDPAGGLSHGLMEDYRDHLRGRLEDS